MKISPVNLLFRVLIITSVIIAGVHFFSARKVSQESSVVVSEDPRPQFVSKDYEQILSSASDEDLVLIEMILSLIQNYYVDAKNFQFDQLLKTALDNLQDQGELRFDLSRDAIQLKAGSLQREIPRQWESEELGKVAALFQVARFLKDSGRFPDQQAALMATLNVIVASLDPYSKLLSEDDYRELQEGTEGEFGGLGIMVGVRNNLLTVIHALPHSPASRAGILPLDHILAVNGLTTFGSSLEELIKIMRGLPGTTVTLSLLRDGGVSPMDITLSREIIQVDPVLIHHLKTAAGNAALLLRLESFSLKSYSRLRAEIEKARSGTGTHSIDGIIIDLRSNPGGLLDQAVKISKILLSEGAIVTVKGRETETEYADHENVELRCPVVVLINEDSASASEILAGALKDHERAIVIGQPSFGKGTVQTVFELPAGRALKLTIARYLTPSGSSIQGVGVIPDIWLHPVYKLNKNENLLGNYRYREEDLFIGFKNSRGNFDLKSLLINGYYLRDSAREVDVTGAKEVEVALDLFDEFKKTMLNPQSLSFVPSSMVLRKLKTNIESKLKPWDGQVTSFLNTKHVNWQVDNSADKPVLHLSEFSAEPQALAPGQMARLRFKVRNEGRSGLSRISVFVRSHREMDTVEKLIGYIAPHSELSDRIELEIPTLWAPGKTEFQIGIAVNGFEIPKTVRSFTLEINPREEPVLKLTSSLVGSENSSQGLLKAGENVKLQIKIMNDSDVNIHIDQLKVENLSGRQISVKSDIKVPFQEIAAHSKLNLTIEIAGSKAIYSDRLGLGLSLESHDLRNPFSKLIYLNAVPNIVNKTRFSVNEK